MESLNTGPREKESLESTHSSGFNTKSVVEVSPDTRNHLGFFVSEETYTLIEETETGWAYICVDDSEDGFHGRCHFVNPADIRFLKQHLQ